MTDDTERHPSAVRNHLTGGDQAWQKEAQP
jgi:hypothetical protein